MKNYLYGIFAIAFLAFTACTNEELPTPGTGQDTPVEHKSGEILVKFSPYVSEILDKAAAATRSGGPATRSGILSVDEVLDIVGGYQIERVFPVDGRNEERTRESELHLWYVVRFGDDYSAEEVAEKLSALGEVQHVNLNRTIRRAYNAGKKAMPLTREALAAMQRATRAAGDTGYPFNDELLPMQWHLINRGNLFGEKSIVDADVQCEEAWKSSTGDKSIIVAVLDEGVMVEHPDLKNNMWVNEGEVYRSKQDNDGNGYKGDVYGYNFVFDTGVISWDDVSDTGHGTHVAGVIAAQNNNGIGISSIAGGNADIPGVKIMSCQIFSGNAVSNSLATVRAIKYAADNGAVICQNSWGYTAGTISETDWKNGTYSALTRAIQYFNKYAGLDENGNQTGPMAGGIVVFAAGNDASNENCYPAADANVVSVGALSYLGTPSYYTNYGKWVSMSAPGGDLMLSNAYGGVYSTSVAADGGSAYEGIQGTSMACPHVSGACALAISYYYGAEKRKGLTGEMLRQALLSSTQPVDRFCTGNYAGYEGMMGIGRLDAYKLLLTIAKMDGIPAQKVAAGATVSLDLRDYFLSANILGYTVSDPGVIGVSLQGGVMQIKGLRKGEATVIVSDGAAIRKPVEVTVE